MNGLRFRSIALAVLLSWPAYAFGATFTFAGEISGARSVYGITGPAIAAAFPLTDPFHWEVTYGVDPTPSADGDDSFYSLTSVDIRVGPHSFSRSGSGVGRLLLHKNGNVDFEAQVDGVAAPGVPGPPLTVFFNTYFLAPPGGRKPSSDAGAYVLQSYIFAIDQLPATAFVFYEPRFPGSAIATLTSAHIDGDLLGIPEPASWALMILGFGAVGAALRRRLATTTA